MQSTDRDHIGKVKGQEREMMLADMRAAVEFRSDRTRQMPDPLGGGDLRYLVSHAPKLDECERLVELQALVNHAGVAWGSRKADLSCRDMIEGNPWVQIVMRKALRSTCRWLTENQSRYSSANRVEFRVPQGAKAEAACTASFRAAFPRHLRRLAKMARGHNAAILADAHRLYPSLQPTLIYHRMRQIGAKIADARTVATQLERAHADTRIPGLPISDETSGWLSELAMHSVRCTLSKLQLVDFMIWVDDIYIGNGSPVIAETGLAAFQTALQEIGTLAAPKKTQRSWDLDITPNEMIRKHWPSHGGLLFYELDGDSAQLADKLLDVVRDSSPDLRLLKSLLTLTTGKRDVPPQTSRQIVLQLLAHPTLWEQCCPQARLFLRFHANTDERALALNAALDLRGEGIVGSEQRVALLTLIEGPDSLPPAHRGPAARALLAHSRQANAVPERQWARAAAYLIDPFTIRRATIDSGEFNDLHAFEQRTAIAFAELRQHHQWLERQRDSGRWPTAAEARMEGQLKVGNRRSAA